MQIPDDIGVAIETLNTIWSKYRLERVTTLHKDELKFIQFTKKFYIWEIQTNYIDVRDNMNEKAIAFLFIPPGKTLGSEFSNYIIQHYFTTFNHVVMIRTKESKSAVTAFDTNKNTIWETIAYDEVKVNKMLYSQVPSYQIIVDKCDFITAFEELQIKSRDELIHIPHMLFRIDPISRLLGFREGDLVRITSVDAFTGEAISYRLVVSNSG